MLKKIDKEIAEKHYGSCSLPELLSIKEKLDYVINERKKQFFVSTLRGPKSCKRCIFGPSIGQAKCKCNGSYESHIKFFPKDRKY